MDFNDNKFPNFDSFTNNSNPNSDNEFANKNYVDESLRSVEILGFNQTLQNYLKVSIGNDDTIPPNMIKFNLRIQQQSNIQIKVFISYSNGLWNVVIEITMEK